MDISHLVQQLLNGLVMGSIYALVALGYTMVYGILGLINFAHGEVVMLGAMVSLSVSLFFLSAGSIDPVFIIFFSLFAAVLFCIFLGYMLERVAYRPLRGAPRLAPLITAIGLSFVLRQIAMVIWGRSYNPVPPLLPQGSFEFLGAHITTIQLLILGVSILVMTALVIWTKTTLIGKAMRATSEAPEIVALMGVNVNKTISVTFIVGAGLAAIAGMLVSANFGITHYEMGTLLGLKAFTAAVLGGIGNIPGAMLGGILLGLIESLGAGYIGGLTNGVFGSEYQDVFVFIILVLVLLIRPKGLLGE